MTRLRYAPRQRQFADRALSPEAKARLCQLVSELSIVGTIKYLGTSPPTFDAIYSGAKLRVATIERIERRIFAGTTPTDTDTKKGTDE